MVFYGWRYLKYFENEGNMRDSDQREYSPKFFYWKHLQAIDPPSVTITKAIRYKKMLQEEVFFCIKHLHVKHKKYSHQLYI